MLSTCSVCPAGPGRRLRPSVIRAGAVFQEVFVAHLDLPNEWNRSKILDRLRNEVYLFYEFRNGQIARARGRCNRASVC